MEDTVSVAGPERTASVQGLSRAAQVAERRRCETIYVVRQDDTESLSGTVRRSALRFEPDSALPLKDGAEFVFGCP